jgi:hypothetical protein
MCKFYIEKKKRYCSKPPAIRGYCIQHYNIIAFNSDNKKLVKRQTYLKQKIVTLKSQLENTKKELKQLNKKLSKNAGEN